MRKKILFASILLGLFFLVLIIPLIQASLIGNVWYNTLAFLGIIQITNANHLNSDRVAISDIYNEVYALDNIWSETIPANDYVRVTFEKNLTNQNDITIFPRVVSGTPIVEVYEKNSESKIAEFNPIKDNEYNKIYLTNLQESQDTFDLKILNGDVQFDYIVDPTPSTGIDGSTTGNTTRRSANATLTTTHSDDIIIIFAGGTNATIAAEITSITDTAGLTWINRKNVSNSVTTITYLTEWYAIAPSVLTNDRIEVNWSNDGTNLFVAFAISGANTTAPFDTNITLPANNSYPTTSNVTTNVSTSHNNNMIISGVIGARAASATCRTFTVGFGFTRILTSSVPGNTKCATIDTQYNNVTSLQDKAGVYEIGSSTSTTAYIIIADAIMALPTYSQFSGYSDNNASLINTGTGVFTANVTDTNGSVYLSINGVNVTAENKTVISAESSSIYNFATCTTGTTCWAENWDVDVFPFSDTIGNYNAKILANAANYTAASSLDGLNWTTANPGSGDEPLLFMNFTIAESVERITEINFTFCGAKSNNTATTFGIYVLKADSNWLTNSNWLPLGTNMSTGSQTVCFSRNLSSNFRDYVKSNNQIVWLVAQAMDNNNMRIDYVEMNITYATDYISYGGETFNATYNFASAGTYPYTWISYSDDNLMSISDTRSYTVNSSGVSTCTYSSGNWAITCSDNCTISSNVAGSGGTWSAVGMGNIILNANITNFNLYHISGGCNVSCLKGCINYQ